MANDHAVIRQAMRKLILAGITYDTAIKAFKKLYLETAIEECPGKHSRSRAQRLVGVHRNTFMRIVPSGRKANVPQKRKPPTQAEFRYMLESESQLPIRRTI